MIAAAAKAGAITERIDQKVDKDLYQQGQTTLERRLGEMQGDIRVIRTCVTASSPNACR